jgi:hypothetical protein
LPPSSRILPVALQCRKHRRRLRRINREAPMKLVSHSRVVAFAVVALAMAATSAAQAFTIDDQSNTNSDGSAKFSDPDSRFSGTGNNGTTIRQGNTTLRFGNQRTLGDERYNNDRMFQPNGRPAGER